MTEEQPSKSKKYRLWSWRASRMIGEALLVTVVLLALVVGFAAWRLSSGPLDVAFAREYVESALRNPDRGTYATMDRLYLQRPDLAGPLELGLQGVKIFDGNNKVIVAVDEAAISLSRTRLLIGQIAPVSLSLKKPALRVIRGADGSFDVGFSGAKDMISPDVAEQADDQTSLVERILDYIARPGDTAAERTPLATLKAFEIEGARVMVEDHVIGVTWFLPRLDASFHATGEGLESDFYAEMPGGRERESFVSAKLLIDWDTKDVAVLAQLKNFDAHMLAGKIPELAELHNQDIVADAQLEALLDSTFRPKEARLLIASASGGLQVQDTYEKPVPFQNLKLVASYNAAEQRIAIPEFRVEVDGIPVSGEAELTGTENRFSGPVKIAIDEVRQEEIGPLWPESMRHDSSHKWIVEKMSDGTFRHAFAVADVILEKKPEQGWRVDAKDIKAGFSFENMTVDYRSPMIPVKQAWGKGTFDYATETLAVDIESAAISDLKVTQAHLEFKDIIKKGAGHADLQIKIEGPLKSGLEYVSLEPIAMKQKFPLEQVKGALAADINVQFPTHDNIKIAEVKVGVNGAMNDVFLPDVVKGLDLTDGPYALQVKDEQVQIKGSGKLSGRAIKLDYKEFLHSEGKPYKYVVTADLTADAEFRKYFNIDLDDFIEGSSDVSVVYTEFHEGKSQAEVKADLTQTRLMVDPFDYDKPPGVEASATATVVLQDGFAKAVRNLTATAPQLSLEKSDLAFVQRGEETVLSQGRISRFTINETVAKMDIDVAASGQMKVVMTAPFLDLRPFLDSEEEKKVYDDPPMLISVAADRMRTSDEQTVQYGKIYVDVDQQGQFNQLEMDAIIGSGDMYMRFKPDASGKRVFRFEADDAGATLKAFGLYENMKGGTMTAYAEPIKGVYDRNLVGLVEINNFTVVKAPVLAQLLGALSLPGLLGLLGDEGISFSKMEAKFNWLYSPKGSVMVFKDGRTSGNSLGLTFDGKFDKAAGKVDISGTAIPLSGINDIIKDIPLIGDILTGGTGGVFAATYTVKGSTEKPETFVNPLSILTPGILRRILFEND